MITSNSISVCLNWEQNTIQVRFNITMTINICIFMTSLRTVLH